MRSASGNPQQDSSPSLLTSRTCISRPFEALLKGPRTPHKRINPMVLTIAGFEFRQRLRRISTYVYFIVFCGLGYLFTLMSGGAVPGASVNFGTGGKVAVNSPYALDVIIAYVTFFGVVVTAAIAGQATYQDVDNHAADFFFTSPITKFDYLGGRFLGALAIQIVIFASVGLGG